MLETTSGFGEIEAVDWLRTGIKNLDLGILGYVQGISVTMGVPVLLIHIYYAVSGPADCLWVFCYFT